MSVEPIHILFVCTGNTCRSPMAEAIFREKAAGRTTSYQFRSAGIAAAVGSPASPHTLEVLQQNSVVLNHFESQPVTALLLDEADYVFCMSARHREAMSRHFPQHREKTFLIGEFLSEGPPVEIADPFGMDLPVYQEVAAQLKAATMPIFEAVEEHRNLPEE